MTAIANVFVLWAASALTAAPPAPSTAAADAAERLAASRDEATVRALIGYLEDHRTGTETLATLVRHDDPDVRRAAALALARNEADFERARPALERALSDTDASVRRIGAFGLGQLGDPSAEPVLLAWIDVEQDPAVRAEVLRALARIGGKHALKKLEDRRDPESVRAAGLVCARLSLPAVKHPAVAVALGSDQPATRAAGLYAVSRAGADALTKAQRREVAALLASDDADLADAAARVLARGADGAEKAVARAVVAGELDGHRRAALIGGLERSKGDATTRQLVRILAAEAKRVGKAGLVSVDLHALLAAARALIGRKLPKSAAKTLKGVLAQFEGRRPPGIRRVAALRCAIHAALGRFDACTTLEQARYGPKAGKGAAFLAPLLADKRSATRMEALRQLAALKKGDPTRAILRALKDRDPPVVATAASLAVERKLRSEAVRAAVARAWERLGAAGNVEVAADLLGAVDALLPDREAGPILEAAAASGETALRRKALSALARRAGDTPSWRARPLPADLSEAALGPYRPTSSRPTLVVRTQIGTFRITLRDDLAPRTVAHIARLAGEGFYDGLPFHRVVPAFVVQGGDPRGDGWGGPGRTIRCENDAEPYRRGTVGMALAGKDTGGSQWFVAITPQPHLLGTYTVFGEVAAGQDVVDRLVEGDLVLEARVER